MKKSPITSVMNLKATLAAVLLMTGCASIGMAGNGPVNIEKVSSAAADVRHVWIKRDDGHAVISGQLHSRLSREGVIPGVVIVEILDSHGQPQSTSQVEYQRLTVNSHTAKFSLALDSALAPDATVRVIHASNFPLDE